MASPSKSSSSRRRKSKPSTLYTDDPQHHLSGPFMPQTPLGSNTPERTASPFRPKGFRPQGEKSLRRKLFGWAVEPGTSFKILLVPLILYINWEILAPFVAPGLSNPFERFLFITGYVPTSKPGDPRYAKTYNDLVFIAYYIVFWSMIRQLVAVNLSWSIARSYGIKKISKLERFGEQGYAVFYFSITGIWGLWIMRQLPTWFYETKYFWIDYPHWDMIPSLKRYYLMQIAYWCQQLIVLVMGLEKPRPDYYELVAHHVVTLWLVGWSYLMNLTLIGNAVYVSMDIPDDFLAFSKILNYLQFKRAKVVSFVVFVAVWTYFRHWLNWRILYSVWAEFDLIPEAAKQWKPEDGVWMVWWLKYQTLFAIGALQALNLFWYYLVWRVAYRAIVTSETTDVRSDDEDDGDDDADEKDD